MGCAALLLGVEAFLWNSLQDWQPIIFAGPAAFIAFINRPTVLRSTRMRKLRVPAVCFVLLHYALIALSIYGSAAYEPDTAALTTTQRDQE
jgi:hypothetical protein